MREVFHPKYEAQRSGHLNLTGFSERGFEHFVFDEVLRSVAAQPPKVAARCHVDLTPRSADRGRDVVVTSFAGDTLLGFRYSAPPATVVAECKLVSKQRLGFEHVAANLLQLQEQPNAVFLLVTNASLTPRALALIQGQCDRVGASFQLIDAYNFGHHFPEFAEPEFGTAPLQVSYQVLPNIYPEGPGYTIHIIVRSFNGRRDVGVQLHSTRNWINTSESAASRALFGDGVACFTLCLRPRGARAKDSVKVMLTLNGIPELFEVNLSPAEYFVDLPLFGSLAESVAIYDSHFRSGKAPDVLFLHAPSGTGKTRFLAEVARRAGLDRVEWFVMREDETAFVKNPATGPRPSRKTESVKQRDLLRHLKSAAEARQAPRVILIDDLHLAHPDVLDAIESLVLEWREKPRLLLSGRSDPASRKPRYEAFAHLVQDNSPENDSHLQYLTLSNVSGAEVAAVLQQLLPDDSLNFAAALSETSDVRPVEIVQYVHSLLERRFVYWADENRLGVNREEVELLRTAADSLVTISVLDARLKFLASQPFDDFTLLELFVLLAIADNPALTFEILQNVRMAAEVSPELLSYWFRQDPSASIAFLAHDTIAERLMKRGYNFRQQLRLAATMRRFSEIRDHLTEFQLAVVHLHERDFGAAEPAMTAVARKLKRVRNVSSLSLEHALYEEIGALIFFLGQHDRRLEAIVCRTLIARAYLNMHHQEFVSGLLDCLGLLTLLDDAQKKPRSGLTRLAVRQLMAHGLLNSGDLRTALSLMHEVENSLRMIPPSRLMYAVEFDMCDRLQAYYTQQSSFDLARSFLLRGRRQAYRAGDEALINISLSAEFHLHRYLDTTEALRLALRQRRHAKEHAPPRSELHADVNEAVAQWSIESDVAPPAIVKTLEAAQTTSRRRGYGHLVPRLDYLLALDSYRRHLRGQCTAEEVTTRITAVHRSALRFGYGEYVWLADNLRLLTAIHWSAPAPEIVNKATRLIDDLARDGLAFIAGEYLCFQNVVVLSNALRALYIFGDEQRAWLVSEKVQFSPLICSGADDREQRIQAVFDGGLLARRYDPAAVMTDRAGYFTILV